MGLHLLLAMSVLDLAGLFFGIRMLLSGFKDKAKYPLLQRYRLITISQFVCQVTILATNTLKASIDFQHEESLCSAIGLVTMSTNFFVISNFVAMAVVHYHLAVVNFDRELSPKLVWSVTSAVGFVTSAIISWSACFCQNCVFHVVFSAFIWLLSYVTVAIVAWRSYKHIRKQEEQTDPKASTKASQHGICCGKKTLMYVVCFGAMVTSVCLYCYESFEGTGKLYKEALYLFAVSFIVGIVLPVSFKDLIESNYEEQNWRKPVEMTASKKTGPC